MLTPPDQSEADRMRDAFDTAAMALDCQLTPTTQETWGWNGRALAAPVSHKDRTCWLRVAAALDAVRSADFPPTLRRAEALLETRALRMLGRESEADARWSRFVKSSAGANREWVVGG